MATEKQVGGNQLFLLPQLRSSSVFKSFPVLPYLSRNPEG